MNEIENKFEDVLTPKIGWGSLLLGDSLDSVRQKLADLGIESDVYGDSMSLDLFSPAATLHFLKGKIPSLAMISIDSPNLEFQGEKLIGQPIDQALTTLGVKRFEDTLWSMTSVECEIIDGKPIDNSKRLTKGIHSDQLLQSGTLWVKSLGVGLSLFDTIVVSVTLCQPERVPQIGCGELDQKTLLDSVTGFKSSTIQPPRKSFSPQGTSRWKMAVAGSIAITGSILLGLLLICFRDHQSWQGANEVVGVVVETQPEGPFPDSIVVEYSVVDGGSLRASIPSQYTTAWSPGDEVTLVYLKDNPRNAMTRLQSRDQAWLVSPYAFVILIPLLIFEICLLYPNFYRGRF